MILNIYFVCALPQQCLSCLSIVRSIQSYFPQILIKLSTIPIDTVKTLSTAQH